MNTDTPETDKMEYYFSNHDSCAGESYYTVIGGNDVTWSKEFDGYSTPSEFSRRLERERNQARKERDELHDVCNRIAQHAVNDPQMALAELLAMDGILRKALEKLKEPKSEGV